MSEIKMDVDTPSTTGAGVGGANGGSVIIREGYTLVGKAKTVKDKLKSIKFQRKFICLTIGSLHIYKKNTDKKPKVSYSLINAKINSKTARPIGAGIGSRRASTSPNSEEDFVLKISVSVKGSSNIIALQLNTKEDLISWTAALKSQLQSKVSTPPPLRQKSTPGKSLKDSKEKNSSKGELKRGGSVFRAQKNIAQVVFTSDLGKKIMREFASESSIVVLDLAKKFVEKNYGSDKADRVEKTLMKTAVKVAMLYKGGILSADTLQGLRLPILRVWNSFIDQENTFSRDLEACSRLFSLLRADVRNALDQTISEKNLSRIDDLFAFLGAKETLLKMFGEQYDYPDPLITDLCERLRQIWDTSISQEEQDVVLKDWGALIQHI